MRPGRGSVRYGLLSASQCTIRLRTYEVIQGLPRTSTETIINNINRVGLRYQVPGMLVLYLVIGTRYAGYSGSQVACCRR